MVELLKMSKEDFEHYLSNAVTEYANEKIKAGTWAEKEAHKLSQETFSKLLPNGVDTEKQYLFSVVDDTTQVKIGYLWFHFFESLIGKEAFIYDIYLFEEFRGKGYGSDTMRKLEAEAKNLGIIKITLHVFSHNERAIAVYKKSGYQDTDLIMSKYI